MSEDFTPMDIHQPKLFQRCGGRDCPDRLRCWRNQKPPERLNVWHERKYLPGKGCEYFVGLPYGFQAVDRDPDPLLRPLRDD